MSAGRREVAHRVFAAEYDAATFEYSESDEERAPNYVVTPTGARVNRLFLAGVLTEVEPVSEDVLRGRIADPTGVFVVYAGQYQPDALAFLERAEPPVFVAVTGKARTFSPEGSDRVFTSVRPESVSEVDAETRDRWVVTAAEHTLARVATFAAALDLGIEGDRLRAALRESGVEEGLAAGIPLAVEEYGTTEGYLAAVRDLAVDALRLVAGEIDEIDAPDAAPDARRDGSVDPEALAETVPGAVVDLRPPEEPAAAAGSETADAEAADSATADAEPGDSGVEAGGDDRAAARGPDDATADDLGDFEPGAVGADDAGEPDEPPEEVLDDEERERIEAEYGTEFETGAEVDEPGEAGIEPEADVGAGAAGAPAEGAGDEATAEAEAAEAATAEAQAAAETAEAEGEATAGAEAAEATGDEAEGEATAGAETEGEATGAEAEGEATEAEAAEASGAEAESEASGGEADGAGAAEEATGEGEAGEPGEVDLEAAVVEAMRELDAGDGADREELVAAVADEHGVEPAEVEDAIQEALMAGKCYEPEDGRLKAI